MWAVSKWGGGGVAMWVSVQFVPVVDVIAGYSA